jgi:HEAT repeat protein
MARAFPPDYSAREVRVAAPRRTRWSTSMQSKSRMAASLLMLCGVIGSAFGAGDGPLTDEGAAKQARLRSVVAELRARDVSGLTAEKRTARTRAIDLLAEYAERGRFTVHHMAWPRSEPLFIDEFGTRCALASVLDGFGEDAVVERLAFDCNDAYLAEIPDDPDVARVLDELGLTVDEAAYIQGPGERSQTSAAFVGGGAGGPVTVPEAAARSSERSGESSTPQPGNGDVTPNDGTPTKPATSTTPKAGAPPAPNTAGSGAPSVPRNGRTGGAGAPAVGRRGRGDGAFTWFDWFDAHRDEFVNVRARFHSAFPATPDATVRARRPTAQEIRDEVLPILAGVAKSDQNLRSTAIAVWARGASTAEAADVREAALAYLADPNQRERGWGAVMLAILADPSARGPLAELVTDSAAGRKLLCQTSAVADGMRALAAIAYGRSGGSVALLKTTLEDSPAAHPDLAAACVVAIGLAAREPSQHVPAIQYLVGALKKPELPASALAQLPGALFLTSDPAVVPELVAVVEHFRGPRELRRACALALGECASDFDDSLRESLTALARRDVDGECRHAAIVSLGMLAARHGATASKATLAQLVAFHEDALAGKFHHDEDLAWHALSAGLFVRGVPTDAGTVLPALRMLATKAGDETLRAAACLGLGLAMDEIGAPILVEALAHGNEMTATYAAHALGLVGIQSARPELLERCLATTSEPLGFAAASALGALADPSAVGPLLAVFEKTPSAAVRAGLARALGEVGDRGAIAGLRRIALDSSRDNPSRERALAALGVLAQADDVAWNAPLKHAVDSGAATPALRLLLQSF